MRKLNPEENTFRDVVPASTLPNGLLDHTRDVVDLDLIMGSVPKVIRGRVCGKQHEGALDEGGVRSSNDARRAQQKVKESMRPTRRGHCEMA